MSGEASTGKKRPWSQRQSNRNTRAKTPQKKRRAPDDSQELDSYLKFFPPSTAGTVKTWKRCEETANSVKEKLRELYGDKSITIEEKARKARQIISNLKSDTRIKSIDMDLDWSEVEEILPDLEKSTYSIGALTELLNRAVSERIHERTRRLQEVSDQLKAMSKYSNKNETKTYATATENQEDDYCSPEEVKKAMAGVKIPSPLNDERALNDAMNDEYEAPWWPAGKNDEDLTNFANFLNDLLLRENTSLLEPLQRNDTKEDKKKYRDKIAETNQFIRNWDKTEYKDIPADKLLYFPSEMAGEKDGVQPVLYSILWALATMSDRKGEDIHRERAYPPLNNQDTGRKIDFEAGELRQWSQVALPITATQPPIEAKNIARKSQNAESMHEEGTKQNVGHCSKRVIVSLDVGNTGVDGSSTSILLTPVYAQAVKVSLKDTGSEKVKIETKFSRMFPLVNREAFNKLVVEENNKKYLTRELFPPNHAESAVPTGLKHLHDLIRASERDLGGIVLNQPQAYATFEKFDSSNTLCGFEKEDDIGELIGTGTHGHVYSLVNNGGSCVKASRVGETCHIERELITMRKLSADGDAPNQIPRLSSMGRVKYNIRKSAVTVPAFLFGPKGIPVTILRKNGMFDDKLIEVAKKLWFDISKALTYCHAKIIIHLDLRVENFYCDQKNEVFVLGDWSSSVVLPHREKTITGFRGALAFASAMVHSLSCNKKGWVPKPEHDVASLGLSIAAFIAGKSVPWSGFCERIKDRNNPCFEERREMAKEILLNMDEAILESFVGH